MMMLGAILKAIRVASDEALPDRLDSHPAVRQPGRSAVLREAARDLLRRLESEEVGRRHAIGYGDSNSIQTELSGWYRQGVWPAD